jgi:hypothetical protein
MPRLTRWLLRTALLWLVAALTVGALLAAGAVVRLPAVVGSLGPAYFHLLMVGWVTQLIVGMVFWMFPKYSAARPRGNEALGWAVYALLNSGLALRLLAEPWHSAAPGPLPAALLVVSAGLQWLAGMGFVVNTWARVKER